MEESDLAAALGGPGAEALGGPGADAFGGPGPEDWLNGAAALASALVREARTLAQAAVALRGAIQPTPGEAPDMRRAKLAQSAAADAALKAALMLDAAELLGTTHDPAAVAQRLAATARRAGTLPGLLSAPLRAAALTLTTDDGAARIAAASLAQEISARLNGA